jgi:hypothetical protein
MPRSETILQVFVGSPSDVAEERAALEELIREFNGAWARSLGIRLELVRWETDAVPGFGDDAQDVVNRSVPTEYDIFIGIMWARVGAPTKRSGSGTIEEFERAYARFKEDPTSVQILFYFKDEPVAPSKLDPEQLAKVMKFREELGPLGGLYWTFTATSDFLSFARLHLSRVVQQWGERAAVVSRGASATAAESVAPVEDEEDEGFIDLIEEANEAMQKGNQVVERMTQAMSQLGDKVRSRAVEMDTAREKGGQADLKALKRIIGGAAEDLDEYVQRTLVDTPVFAEQLKRAVTAYGKAALLAREFGDQDGKQLAGALTALQSLRSAMAGAKGHLVTFTEAVAGTPRMTTAYNHARRRTLDVLRSLLSEYEVADQLIMEVEKSLEALVPKQ